MPATLSTMGKNSPQSRRLANVRLQLRTGEGRNGSCSKLTPERIAALMRERDELVEGIMANMEQRIMDRVVEQADRVNAHTTSVVVAEAVGVKQAFVQTFCPEVVASPRRRRRFVRLGCATASSVV